VSHEKTLASCSTIAACAWAVALTAPAAAQPMSREVGPISIVLHLAVEWESSIVGEHVLQGMQDEVTAIWGPQGVLCLWEVSSTGGSSSTAPPVRIVVIDNPIDPQAAPLKKALGWIDFHRQDGQSSVLYVSATAVKRLASMKRYGYRDLPWVSSFVIDRVMARALGRATAHEIGHYLLGTRRHSGDGLMRAAFRASDLVRRTRDGFTLDRAQRSELRASAVNRLASP
jgi:hypothetical protein